MSVTSSPKPAAVLVIFRDDPALRCHPRRELYERALDQLGCDPADVMAVRVSESGVEVDVIDFEHPEWPVRTLRRGRVDRSSRRASPPGASAATRTRTNGSEAFGAGSPRS